VPAAHAENALEIAATARALARRAIAKAVGIIWLL
jgi:hypothetical protein